MAQRIKELTFGYDLMLTEISPASKILTKLNIPHLEHVHTTEITSLKQAAAERNQDPSQVVRSIVFRLSDAEYAMVLIAGECQESCVNG